MMTALAQAPPASEELPALSTMRTRTRRISPIDPSKSAFERWYAKGEVPITVCWWRTFFARSMTT